MGEEMDPGTRDRLAMCGQFACDALDLDDESNSPLEVKEAIERLQDGKAWATGVMAGVDFEPTDTDRQFEADEMMVHIITPQGGVCAGHVQWRMVAK